MHLWLALPDEIDDARLLATYLSWLDDQELERCDRFVSARARHLFIVSHALVRSTLSLYADVHPAAWRFTFNDAGKPEVVGPAVSGELRFSLSHVGGLAACAVTRSLDCGVDVDDPARVADPLAVARHWFAADEYAALLSLPEEECRQRFFELWTLKEAYTKARGLQLAPTLNRVSFDPGGDRGIGLRFAPDWGDQPEHWQFALLEQSSSTGRFVLAVAVRRGSGDDRTLVVRECVPEPLPGYSADI
ncbi:MAG: 4'-phosphopantetheinyl transferase family protein [Candidatus Binatia bacterium]